MGVGAEVVVRGGRRAGVGVGAEVVGRGAGGRGGESGGGGKRAGVGVGQRW